VIFRASFFLARAHLSRQRREPSSGNLTLASKAHSPERKSGFTATSPRSGYLNSCECSVHQNEVTNVVAL